MRNSRTWLQNVESVRPSPGFWRLAVACSVLSCAGASPRLAAQNLSSEATAPTSIHGTVLNRVTNEPISRALVYSNDEMYATLTDDRGHFEFKFPAAESKPLNRLDGGAETDSYEAPGVRVAQNVRPTVFLARKPGFLFKGNDDQEEADDEESGITAPPSEITLFLDPEALIFGNVLLDAVESTEHVRVELYSRTVRDGQERWEFVRAFICGSNGGFRLHELPPGTYKLGTHELLDRDQVIFDPHGQRFGYPPVFYPNAPDLSRAAPIHITEGSTVQVNLSPVRREYFPVKISVANLPPGSPPKIFVYLQGHPGPGYSLAYAPNEEVIQGDLPDGNYTVRVTATNGNGSVGILNFVVRGAPVEGPRVTMELNAPLMVNVRAEYGPGRTENQEGPVGVGDSLDEMRNAPQPTDVLVKLSPAEEFGPDDGATSHPVAGAAGNALVIDNVQPGRYWVQVESGSGYPASVQWGGTDLLHQPMEIGADGSSSPIEITMRDDGAEVSGIVRSLGRVSRDAKRSAVPPPQTYVYFLPVPGSGGQFRECFASEDGAFVEEQLAPGAYRVLAVDQRRDELEHARDEVLRKYEFEGQVIRVTGGQKERLELTLSRESLSE